LALYGVSSCEWEATCKKHLQAVKKCDIILLYVSSLVRR